MPSEEEQRRKELKSRQQLDQSSATLGDLLPPLWWRLFQNCQDAGFDELQSFVLIQTYILSQCPNGVNSKKD